MPSKLSSARSIFEQNIRKNKEAGVDKNIFGHKPSQKASRRLFAHQRLFDSGNDSSTSLTHNIGNASNPSAASNSYPRRNSSSTKASPSAGAQKQEQPPQTQQQAQSPGKKNELKQPSVRVWRSEETTNQPASSKSQITETKLRSKKLIVGDAQGEPTASKTTSTPLEVRREGSITSLADHLNKLNLKSLSKQRDHDDASTSQTSLVSHRDRLTLPDFRQSSTIARRNSRNNSRLRQKLEGNCNDSVNGEGSMSSLDNPSQSQLDNSFQSQLDNSSQSQLDNSSQSHPRTLASSNSQARRPLKLAGSKSTLEVSSSSLDDARLTATTTSWSRSHPRRDMGRSNSRRSSSRTTSSSSSSHCSHKTAMQMADTSDTSRLIDASERSTGSRIRDSSSRSGGSRIRDMSDSSRYNNDGSFQSGSSRRGSASSAIMNEPLTTVPFPTRTVIKRHSSISSTGSGSPMPSASRRIMVIPSSTSHSQSTAASASSSPSNSPPERVAGRRKISTKKQQKREVIDPEGQELLRQIEEMRQKIAASEAVLVRVHEGERADLRRVQETKERKLRRVETTEKQRRAVPGSSRQEQQDESALKDKIKESQQIIKTLKRENAKIHTQNHQLKLQILTTASSNSLLQDQLEETRAMCSQAERHHKQHTEAEHDSLLRLVANYESGTMDLEDAIDGKASQLERVKKSRRQYEDRVDQIVEYLQQKCKDAQLVEEVVALADDDDGWDDCSSDDDDESQVCTKTFRHKRLQKLSQSTLKGTMPYKQSIDYDEAPRTPVDKDSPKSVSDLITLSSHSLHIFS